MASTMQLEFAQAMSDFKKMFPQMEGDVIEAVLRANMGAVDATIDQLLAMSIDNQKTSPNTLRDGGDLDVKHGLPLHLSPASVKSSGIVGASPKIKGPTDSKEGGSSTNGATGAKAKSKKWNPPILRPLPPGFLRLTSVDSRDFEIPDEQFAIMLQNEEFMNELRWNEEFMNALEKEQQDKGRNGEEDMIFKERLKHMGKRSRKKFMQVAKVFTWQRNKKPGAIRHPDSLLLQEEHSDDDEPKRVAKK